MKDDFEIFINLGNGYAFQANEVTIRGNRIALTPECDFDYPLSDLKTIHIGNKRYWRE